MLSLSSDPETWNAYVPDGIHPNADGGENVMMPELKRSKQPQSNRYQWGSTPKGRVNSDLS